MIERGFVDRCNRDFEHRTVLSCSILDDANRHNVIPIEIRACTYQLGIFGGGVMFSLVIIAVEILLKRCRVTSDA